MNNRDLLNAIKPKYASIVLHDTDGWETHDNFDVNMEIHGNKIEVEIEGEVHTFELPEIEEEEE